MKTYILFFVFILGMFSCSVPYSESDQQTNQTPVLIQESQIDQCIAVDVSYDPLSIVQTAYTNLFSGDLEGFLDTLSDDVEWIHYGPPGTIPTYGVYYGKQGVTEWAYNLFSCVQMNYFDIHYFVVDGNIVHSQVKEGAFSYGAGTQMYIENFHSFVFNPDGKISKVCILSESYTGVTAYNGENGLTYSTPYENNDYQSTYETTRIDKLKVYKLLFDMQKNGKKNINMFSDDAQIVMTGPEDIVPYMGKFSGYDEIRNFMKKFSKDIRCIDIKYIVKMGNKVNVCLKLYGKSSRSRTSYQSEAVFSFQYDDTGKIARLYGYSDNYTISRSYIE